MATRRFAVMFMSSFGPPVIVWCTAYTVGFRVGVRRTLCQEASRVGSSRIWEQGLVAQGQATAPRARLSRERVLREAVSLADRVGIETLSMRSLAQELSVVPMALYKHVASKEELLD